jgi:hypothetical protein
VGQTTLPCKKKIVEKPPRNSAGFCGGGQGLSWAVEQRKEEGGGGGLKLNTSLERMSPHTLTGILHFQSMSQNLI